MKLDSLPQHFIDGCNTDPLVILSFQEVLDFLPATLPVPAPQLPDPPFELGIPFALAPRTSLGFVIAVQERSQAACLPKPLPPTDDRAPGDFQSLGNVPFGNPSFK